MKRILLILFVASAVTFTYAQENAVTISGGYAWANLSESETNATGWRINGLYEFVPMGGKVSHGVAFAYIGTGFEAERDEVTSTYDLNTMPLYYAPKYTFGEKSFKAFVKGALGMHYSGYKRTGTLVETSTWDMGFYGGAGAGLVFNINEKIFINAEYEWAFISNAFYGNGFMNSAMGGIGIMF